VRHNGNGKSIYDIYPGSFILLFYLTEFSPLALWCPVGMGRRLCYPL